MRIPYGYVLQDGQIVLQQEQAIIINTIFDYYLSGASLGKVVEMLRKNGVLSPTKKAQWTRASIDKLLSNSKYIPIVGLERFMDVQFEKERRSNLDYDLAGHPRKSVRYQSTIRAER